MRAYTHDMTRRPRLSKEAQEKRLGELVWTKRALWLELLRRDTERVLERVAAIHDVTPTRRRLPKLRSDRVRIEALDRLAAELAVTPGATELAREIVDGLKGARATQARWLCDAALRLRSEVVQANLRLVMAVARKFVSLHVHYEDMVADGNMGLLKAADRFDPEYKAMFSTYAIHWIRHEVSRGIDDRGRTVRIPVNARILRREMTKHREVAAARGERLDDDALAALCGVKVGRIRQIDRDTAPLTRLGVIGDDGQDRDREDIADPAEHPDDVMLHRENVARLHELMRHLEPKRAAVLRHRFGLDGADELTLAEIGARMGVSRERIRQRQVAALEDLRAMLERDPGRRAG